MTRQRLSALIATVCLFATASLRAQSGPGGDSYRGANGGASASMVPRLIRFSGKINPQITQATQTKENESGKKSLPAVVGLTFSLYELQEGGSPLWSESQDVQADEQGRYTVLLGATQPEGLPLDLFTSGKALWLGIQPQLAGAVEQPRVLLVAVPYALKASDSDTLGGKPASAYALVGSQTLVLPAGGPALSSASAATSQPGSPTGAASGTVASPQSLAPCPSVTSDGTAAANSIAMFTTNCNLEASAITQSNGNIGISGASLANTKFQITDTPPPDSGIHYTNHELLNTSVTKDGTNKDLTFVMDVSNMTVPAGVTDSGYRIGVEGAAYANTPSFAGTLGAQYGVWGRAGILGGTSGATVTNAYAGYFDLFNAAAGTKITNAYGVYIANSATTGTITNRYDLYASSPAGKSYFAGSVGIGTATPGANLEVAGNVKVSGSGHGIIYPDGSTQTTANLPGTGTVTSVGSGVGLTGGPIMTSGTLSIAAAGVTDAMLVIAYSGTGSCSAGQFVVSLGRAAAPGCLPGNTGTVTSVGSGAGLTGGPITGSGTLSIATGGVTNAMLLNSALTVNAGSGLSGGGSVSLGGTTSLSIPAGGVTNNMLANPSLTVGSGSGLSGGGVVALGGTLTLTNTGILGVGVSAPITSTGGQSPTLSIATAGVTDALLANPYSGVGACPAGKVVMALARNAAPTCVTASVGTVTSVASGAGLTGGPITSSGTLSIATAGVTDAMLANPYSGVGTCPAGMAVAAVTRNAAPTCVIEGTITEVKAGTDLTGGGTVGSVTLNLDTTKVPQLIANNHFIGNQSVTGNLTMTDSAVGDTAILATAGDTSTANTGISGAANGPSGTGVIGDAENGSQAVGVWGKSSSGYAGEFTGNLDVSGTLTAATKDFKIDDPVDPANKYVYHASVESSEMVDIYSGNVTLNGKGEATVQVPAWFETLNGDFRYQLSTIGGFAPVYIAEEIRHGQFKVAGGKPGMKVSWQVTGVRQDAFARAHPLQVEVEKPANERGYYIHPELYGAGQEKSVEWADHPEQMRKMAEQQAKTAQPKQQ